MQYVFKAPSLTDGPHVPPTCSGAAQAGFITVILYTLVSQLDHYFAGQGLPGNYTARNITTAVRTVVAVRLLRV